MLFHLNTNTFVLRRSTLIGLNNYAMESVVSRLLRTQHQLSINHLRPAKSCLKFLRRPTYYHYICRFVSFYHLFRWCTDYNKSIVVWIAILTNNINEAIPSIAIILNITNTIHSTDSLNNLFIMAISLFN